MIVQQIKIIQGANLQGGGGTEELLNTFLEGVQPSNFMSATVEVSQTDSDSKVFCYYRKDTDNFPATVSPGDYLRPQIKVFAEGVSDGSEFTTLQDEVNLFAADQIIGDVDTVMNMTYLTDQVSDTRMCVVSYLKDFTP